MKIITLHQPYASLIALGLKRYETRSWATNYRGRLAIHAAKREMKHEELLEISKLLPSEHHALMQQFWQASLFDTPLMKKVPLGAIVAVVDLVDCEKMLPSNIQTQSRLERAVGDWGFNRYAWKLDNIRVLPEPIPYKGGQGLRFLDDDAIALIDAQLGVTT